MTSVAIRDCHACRSVGRTGPPLGLIGVLAWAAATDLRRFAVFGISGYLVILLAALEVIPAGFQSLIVEPNELELETPFLRHNIALTRAAYGLDKIDPLCRLRNERKIFLGTDPRFLCCFEGKRRAALAK